MTKPIDPQRLRELADDYGYTRRADAQLLRDAADEIERLLRAYNALFEERQELRGVLGHGEQQPPVLSLAELAKNLRGEVERLREDVRVLSSPQLLAETLSGFVRVQAAKAAAKGGA